MKMFCMIPCGKISVKKMMKTIITIDNVRFLIGDSGHKFILYQYFIHTVKKQPL